MDLSSGERLIVLMLAEIMEKIGATKEFDPKFISKCVANGNIWAIEELYSGILDAEEPRSDIRTEVGDILDMWMILEESISNLSDSDREALKAAAYPFGEKVEFPGFDQSRESVHARVANCLVKDMDTFRHFQGRQLTHGIMNLEGYRRMYQAFEPLRPNLADRYPTVDEIAAILIAQSHPRRQD